MQEYFNWALLVFTSFFTLINPIGVLPVFMTMTGDLTEEQRRRTAIKASLVAGFTILFFAFTGQLLFAFFGISIESLRMVGGILFFFTGYDMLQARLTRTKVDESEVKHYVDDISITPLGIPMLCGPGSMTNAIVLMEDAGIASKKVLLVVMIAVVIGVTIMVLISSSKLMAALGETGNKILMRIMGLIVMVIAVEFFFAGLIPKLQPLIH